VATGNFTTAIGTPVNQSLTAYSGVKPYTWQVSGLPAGLTASATGQITGTPFSARVYTVQATVTDANHQFSSI
jgi:hypothetical protein